MSEEIRHDIIRTLAILRELSKGKTLELSSGHTLAMGEDMSIGLVFGGRVVSEINLSSLNALLEREGVGPAVPAIRIKS